MGQVGLDRCIPFIMAVLSTQLFLSNIKFGYNEILKCKSRCQKQEAEVICRMLFFAFQYDAQKKANK